MEELINVKNIEGQVVVSSREVARNFGKRHADVLRDIENLIKNVSTQNCVQYFIQSEYKDASGKTNKEYMLTRDGFSLLVMGFTGKEALRWKLKYIDAFNAMEKSLMDMKALSPELQLLINLELKQKEQDEKLSLIDDKVESIKGVVALNPNDWRKDTSNIVNKIALSMGGYEHVKAIRSESYKLLDERMGVSLSRRLTYKRQRMADEGVCKSKRDKLNQLDVIADDKKLIEGYLAIIKEMAIKYGVGVSQEVA